VALGARSKAGKRSLNYPVSSPEFKIDAKMAQDTIPPMTAEEEGNGYIRAIRILITKQPDAVIQSRLVNDERPLKRLVRKFQSFSTQARSPSPDDSAVDSARASFLQELASFQMLIKKATLTINAEARQVQEYQAERARIGMLES
jgi:hypothetical protein